MRLKRGSGLDGLAAIPEASVWAGVPVLRPLLEMPKARLAATLSDAGIAFVEDPSNADLRFERARVRASGDALAETRAHAGGPGALGETAQAGAKRDRDRDERLPCRAWRHQRGGFLCARSRGAGRRSRRDRAASAIADGHRRWRRREAHQAVEARSLARRLAGAAAADAHPWRLPDSADARRQDRRLSRDAWGQACRRSGFAPASGRCGTTASASSLAPANPVPSRSRRWARLAGAAFGLRCPGSRRCRGSPRRHLPAVRRGGDIIVPPHLAPYAETGRQRDGRLQREIRRLGVARPSTRSGVRALRKRPPLRLRFTWNCGSRRLC